ncbi:MAG: hypothetical protein AAF411_06300 [Myxococcota bacterium]
MRNLLLATGLLLLGGCGRGMVVVGVGESIDHLASFDDETKAQLQAETGFAEPAVGLKYESFSLFFLPVWNWEGDVVVYETDGDRYLPLSDTELREFTGRSADDFSTPFLYRFPIGLMVLLAIVAGAVFQTWRRMRSLDG